VRLAFCWSHVRLHFYELAKSRPGADRRRGTDAHSSTLQHRERYPWLFRRRQAVRQEHSRPLLEDLEPWLRAKLQCISQKTKLAAAIRYTLSRWQGLCLFLDDGRVEIDNNVVERSIRPLALTRKNALFTGSYGGAEHWATIASLVETYKPIGVEPYVYLADVVPRIVDSHPNSRRDELAVGLSRYAQPQSRGMRTSLTKQPRSGGSWQRPPRSGKAATVNTPAPTV